MFRALRSALSGTARTHHQALWTRSLGATPVRDPKFGTLTDDDVSYFRTVVGDMGLVTSSESLAGYNRDWMGKYNGASKLALRPQTTDQVSKILAYCNARVIAVVPQGGNTGLVGGSVPLFDEVILSLSRMDKIGKLDPVSGTLVCGAGCVLETLNKHAEEHGFIMPLDFGAKGSCQIGGNVSTNAGGLRLLRYGSLRGSVLGVEAVLPSGAILDLCRSLRKDNTGYDLKQLFIGGEGTLGIVTSVAISLAPKPSSVQLAFLAVPNFEACLRLFSRARSQLGETLSAFEFLDRASLELAVGHLPGVADPMPDTPAPFYVLVETSSSSDNDKLDDFLEEAMGFQEGLVVNGIVAQDSAQSAAIWRVREGISEALGRAGGVYKYDVSIPLTEMYKLVEAIRERLKGSATVVGYGHLGDSNLHLNISTPGAGHSDGILQQIEPFVYEWVAKHEGSVSAEHGIGAMKPEALKYSKSPEALSVMALIKRSLDPNGIMNPYKMFPRAPP